MQFSSIDDCITREEEEKRKNHGLKLIIEIFIPLVVERVVLLNQYNNITRNIINLTAVLCLSTQTRSIIYNPYFFRFL